MKRFFCILLLLPALLLAPPFSKARADDFFVIEDADEPDSPLTTVTLAWDENDDTDVVSYNLYYGRSSGEYIGQQSFPRTTATVSVRGNRSLYFAVTAVSASGVESPFSGEIRWPQGN